MTAQDLLNLPPAELSRIAAERVMGWESFVCVYKQMYRVKEWNPKCCWKDSLAINGDDWNPSTDRNDAALLLERIKELGREPEFCNALTSILEADSAPDQLIWEWHWKLFNPTTQQLTAAAIAAMEG